MDRRKGGRREQKKGKREKEKKSCDVRLERSMAMGDDDGEDSRGIL